MLLHPYLFPQHLVPPTPKTLPCGHLLTFLFPSRGLQESSGSPQTPTKFDPEAMCAQFLSSILLYPYNIPSDDTGYLLYLLGADEQVRFKEAECVPQGPPSSQLTLTPLSHPNSPFAKRQGKSPLKAKNVPVNITI